MKKILISLLVLSQLCIVPSEAKIYCVGTRTAEIQRAVAGMTFGMDFSTGSTTTTSDLAAVSDIITATVTRGASNPSTYYTKDGKINVNTTSNTLRWTEGYWDATGWHYDGKGRGILTETTIANLLIRTDGTASGSGIWTGWTTDSSGLAGTFTYSQVSASNLTTIASANYQRVQYTGQVGDVNANSNNVFISTGTALGSVVAGDIITASTWMNASNVGATSQFLLCFRDSGGVLLGTTYSSTITNSNGDIRLQITGTAPTNTSYCSIKHTVSGVDNGDIIDFKVYGFQIEKYAYATTWIPTTTASLFRKGDSISIKNGNLQDNIGTVLTKFYLNGVDTGKVQSICRIDATGGYIWMRFDPTGGTERYNVQWGALNSLYNNQTIAAFTKYITAVVYDGTNLSGYFNGALVSGPSARSNLTALGSNNFYLGMGSSVSESCNGVLQQIYIFNTNLSTANVGLVTNIMNT